MRKIYQNLLIGTIFTLLGFVVTFQLIHLKEDYSFVSIETISALQNQVDQELSEINNLKELIKSTDLRLTEYQQAVKNEGSIRDVLQEEINNLKITSGFVDLEGSGITVKISDAIREMYPWESPESLIVHEGDVLMILQELRYAGAEAISINGQRILAHTEIKCSGPTITINNHTYGQPFIIKAIGDPVTLEAAIKSPESYAYLLIGDGLIVESLVSPWVRIPKFEGDIPMQYITPKEVE